MNPVTLAIDAMGGDRGAIVVVPAALKLLAKYNDTRLILVGDETIVQRELQRAGGKVSDRLLIHHASQSVAMDESPTQALRSKKDSSMRVALNLVKAGEAAACVSAGNTGALMATAYFVLKTLPGIDRPAIVSLVPTRTGNGAHMLDLGANVDSTPQHLLQFAVMAAVLASAVHGIARPRVSLLNIGHEDIKGNELVRETARLLTSSGLVNYIGFVEADQIYAGTTDVIVCDGFVGNIALKASEGVAHLIKKIMREEFERNLLTRLAAVVCLPVLRRVGRRINPDHYNGATLIGLRGVVIKSHGGANADAFLAALERARLQAAKNITAQISQEVSRLLNQTEAGSA